VDTSVNYSSNSVFADVTVATPSTPSVSSAIDGDGVLLSWSAASGSFAIKSYEVRYGTDFASGVSVGILDALKFKVLGTWSGARTFWVRATDIVGNSGTAGSVVVTVNGAAAPTITSSGEGEYVNLDWSKPSSDLPIIDYEIRHGASYASGTFVARVAALKYRVKGEWSGSRIFWIAAINSAGTTGTAGSHIVAIGTHGPVLNLFARELNGTTIIDWQPPVGGAMPVVKYRVYRGDIFTSAVLLGSVDATFFTLVEPNAGTYTYWVTSVDSAGNVAPAASTLLSVYQPNGFVLQYNQVLEVANALTISNLGIETDGISVVGPANTSETYQSHFTANGANTIQDLIDDGYEYWLEPGSSNIGIAEWAVDLGAVFTSAAITTTYTATELESPSVVIPQLFWRYSEADRWTRGAPGISSQNGNNYRYVKLRYEVGGDVLDPGDATLSNAVDLLDGTTVCLPAQSGETWEAHFLDNGFTTIQGFIDAGYSEWLQPAPAGVEGVAEWVTDCGKAITSCNGLFTFDVVQVDATDQVSLSYTVETRASPTANWDVVQVRTNLSSGSGIKTATHALAGFRYVRTTLYGSRTPTAMDALARVKPSVRIGTPSGMVQVSQINMQIGVTTRQDSGFAIVSGSDADGTFIPYNLDFVDVIQVNATAQANSGRTATARWQDIPNPTGFYAYMFDSDGNRASGTIGWSASGVVET
jgi:hypothetical protein